ALKRCCKSGPTCNFSFNRLSDMRARPGAFRAELSFDCADFISFVREKPQAPTWIKPDTHSHIQHVSA
ncbi:MAG TPA: hypothetical protein VHV99_10635, partial [Paraburkholderia sp.]|nr:hypothetical protein [Paraburkholderia sp.]